MSAMFYHLLVAFMVRPIAAQFDFRAARFLAISATQVFATKLQKCPRGNTILLDTPGFSTAGETNTPTTQKAAAAASLVAPLWLAGLFVSVSA